VVAVEDITIRKHVPMSLVSQSEMSAESVLLVMEFSRVLFIYNKTQHRKYNLKGTAFGTQIVLYYFFYYK